MRLAGRVSEWNDDKGYGFVIPNGAPMSRVRETLPGALP